jgi:hypothetical protein
VAGATGKGRTPAAAATGCPAASTPAPTATPRPAPAAEEGCTPVGGCNCGAVCTAGVPAATVPSAVRFASVRALLRLQRTVPHGPHSRVLAMAAACAAAPVAWLAGATMMACAHTGTHPVRFALPSRDLYSNRQHTGMRSEPTAVRQDQH